MNKMTSEHVGVIDIIHECERKKNKCTIAVVRDRMGYLRNEHAQKQLDELIDLGIVEYLVSNKTFILTKEGEKFGNNEVELEVVLTSYTRKRYFNQSTNEAVVTKIESLPEETTCNGQNFISEHGWGEETPSGEIKVVLRDSVVYYNLLSDELKFCVCTSKVMLQEYAELMDEILFSDFCGETEEFVIDRKNSYLIVKEASSNVVLSDIAKLH